MGLVPKLGRHVSDRFGYLSGTDQDRAADINAMFADPSVRAIFVIRGGWGNHWRPIFIEDAQALGIDARAEDPAMHPRLAELARLTMLSLRECDR